MEYNRKIHHRKSIRLKGYDYSQAGLYFITICCQDMKCRFGKIEKDEMVLNEFGTIAHNEWMKLPERFPNFELDVFQIMPNHIHGIILLNDSIVRAGFTPAQMNKSSQNVDPVGAGFTPAQSTINNDSIVRTGFTPAQSIINNDSIVRTGFTPAQSTINNDSILRAGFTPAQLHKNNDDKGQPQGIAPTNDNLNRAGVNLNRAGVNPNRAGVNPNRAGVNPNRAGVNPAPTIGDIIGAYKSLAANECLKIYKSNNEIMGKLWQRNYYEHIIKNESSYKTISEYIINNPQQWDKDKFYR